MLDFTALVRRNEFYILVDTASNEAIVIDPAGMGKSSPQPSPWLAHQRHLAHPRPFRPHPGAADSPVCSPPPVALPG
jgi:hypothetical protein